MNGIDKPMLRRHGEPAFFEKGPECVGVKEKAYCFKYNYRNCCFTEDPSDGIIWMDRLEAEDDYWE